MHRILALVLATLLVACTHVIPVDEQAKRPFANCRLKLVDVRTDTLIITPAPGTTYSFPPEIPVEQAVLNRACHSALASQPLTLLLETAKCGTQGGFTNVGFQLRVSVQGGSRPYAAFKNEDAGTPMVGPSCGHNLTKAMDSVLSEIVRDYVRW